MKEVVKVEENRRRYRIFRMFVGMPMLINIKL